MSVTHLMPLDGNTKSWSDFSTAMCGKTYRQLSEDTEDVTAKPADATCVSCLRADDLLVVHLFCIGQTACGLTGADDTTRNDMVVTNPDLVNCSDCINTLVFERVSDWFKSHG